MSKSRNGQFAAMLTLLLITAICVNWISRRSEAEVTRQPLASFPSNLNTWTQIGEPIKWPDDVEAILKATDYTVRDYAWTDGRVGNVYVGYYSSQRTGATYHSPQNCLPGAGWVLKQPQKVDITLTDGRTFAANQYFIENGIYHYVMIYWYHGRGRIESSEYRDKLNTIIDSVSRRRTDAAMVRVMVTVGDDPNAAVSAAKDLAAHTAENLSPFVPE